MLLRGFIVLLIAGSLLACNRKATNSQQRTVAAVETPTTRLDSSPTLPEVRQFPAELNEPLEEHDKEPRTKAGQTARENELNRRARIEASGQPEALASYQLYAKSQDTTLVTLRIMTDNSLQLSKTIGETTVINFTAIAEAPIMPQLLRIAAQYDFFRLADYYPTSATAKEEPMDYGVITTIDWRGRVKRIVHISGGPPDLLAVETYFAKLIASSDWIPEKP